MKGKLAIEYDHPLVEFNLMPEDFIKIPIYGPLCIVLEPAAKVGLYIGLGFKTQLYDEIMDTDVIKKKVDKLLDIKEEEDDEDEDDTMFIIKLSAKAEVSIAASAGIVLGDPDQYAFTFLAGINGLMGSSEIGIGLIINLNRADITLDKFYEIEAFCIDLFLKMQIFMNLVLVKLKIEIYILKYPIIGFNWGKHDKIYLKVLASKLYENFILMNKNQLY